MLLFSSQAPVRQAIVVRFNRHTKGSNRAQLTSHVYKGLNSWHLIHLGNCPPQCKKSRVGEKNIRRVTSQKKLPERWAAQSTGRRDTPRYDAGKLPLLSKEHATVATPSFLGQAVMCFLLPLLTRKGVVDRNSASCMVRSLLIPCNGSIRPCGLWTLSCDFVPRNQWDIQMTFIAARLNVGVILVGTV